MDYSGKTVLITGASSGIGASLAREFSASGANLVLIAREVDRPVALALELTCESRRAIALGADVALDGEIEKAVEQARREFGRIDVVVANAGFGVVGNFERLRLDDFRRQFEVNVFGVLRTIYSVIEDIKKSHGRIVIVGGVAGFVSVPGSLPYGMSKAALRGLSGGLGVELASSGVSVTHIVPGFVDTGIFSVNNQNVNIGTEIMEMKKPPGWLRVSAGQAARQIVRAASKRERMRILSLHGNFLILLQRFFPGVVRQLLRHY